MVSKMEELREVFKHLTGNIPYQHQEDACKALISGRSVILRAPTGSGKTDAALFPFILARKEGLDFPRKLLYCVPMRVLARSFCEDIKTKPQGIGLDARLQTGEQQDDRKLEGDITFATIDQVLSSFLNIPYSLSLRQGNINAGAVVSSYLVFDEFHLLSSGSTLPTTIEMLRMLKGVAPFLLMTATFSENLLGRLANLLDAVVVTVSNNDLVKIPTQRDKERRFHRVDTLLTAEAVLRHHQCHSIVICNTVERAQALFNELNTAINSSTAVILLHSRFLHDHRRDKENKVLNLFGKDQEKAKSVILVATQVIEVGLNITCEVMHTELAPASAILQRAGRCARFESEKGDVYVYQVPLNRKGGPDYAPYNEQATLCKKTWDTLDLFEGQNMNFTSEQRLVDQVHSEADSRMLDALQSTSYHQRSSMNKAISQQEIGLARELIRQDDSVTLLVHASPSKIQNPYNLEGFSLFFGSLHRQFEKWQEEGLPNCEVTWLLKYPQEKESEEGEEYSARYGWGVIENHKDIRGSTIHVVNPLLVKYDAEAGFRFVRDGGFQSPPRMTQSKEADRERYKYSRESYQEHVQKMLSFNQSISPYISYAASRLEQRMGLTKGLIERAVCLAIILHDAGKMDERWQHWAHEWQKQIGAPVDSDCMLAHTDYDQDNPTYKAAEVKMTCSRPNHAAEGATAGVKVLHQLLGNPGRGDPRLDLVKAIFTAIARHHSPKTDRYENFALSHVAKNIIAKVLKIVGEDEQASAALEMKKSSQPISGILVEPGSTALLLYFLIVRALRLADQEAMGKKE